VPFILVFSKEIVLTETKTFDKPSFVLVLDVLLRNSRFNAHKKKQKMTYKYEKMV
jgi:hypothetical protein